MKFRKHTQSPNKQVYLYRKGEIYQLMLLHVAWIVEIATLDRTFSDWHTAYAEF